MSFTQVPALIAFTPLTTILSADVNANYAALRNQFNALVTGTDTLAPFTVSGGPLIVASGIRVTGGVVSGATTFSSGVAISGGTLNVSGVSVSGVATFTSGYAVSGGVVSGIVTFSSGFAITGGVVSGAVVVQQSVTASSITVTNTVQGGNFISASGTAATPGYAVDTGGSGTGMYGNAGQWNLAVGGNLMLTMTPSPNIGTWNAHQKIGAGLNVAMATVVTSATVGYIFVTAGPGTQTGVPNHVEGGGGVALCYDTTNNRLQIYNGGWKTVLLA